MEGTNEKKSILNIYANRGHFSKTKTAFIASRKLSDKWVLYFCWKEILNTHSQETRMHKYKTRFELPFTLYIYTLIHHNSLNPQRF